MNEKVIGLLNDARRRELLAIMQYMQFHYELEDAGYGKLGDEFKRIAITEMKHAEELAERIIFLGGVPISKPEADVQKGLPIQEQLKVGHHLEQGAVTMYNDAANTCAQENDHVSKAIFEKLLADEEEHLDDFETRTDLIETLGNSYLATLTE